MFQISFALWFQAQIPMSFVVLINCVINQINACAARIGIRFCRLDAQSTVL